MLFFPHETWKPTMTWTIPKNLRWHEIVFTRRIFLEAKTFLRITHKEKQTSKKCPWNMPRVALALSFLSSARQNWIGFRPILQLKPLHGSCFYVAYLFMLFGYNRWLIQWTALSLFCFWKCQAWYLEPTKLSKQFASETENIGQSSFLQKSSRCNWQWT